jgi:hypothetical protein
MGRAHAVGVAGIAAQEHAVVEGVLVGNALADGVHRVPLETLPLDRVGLQDPLGGLLDLLGGGGLARVEVGVGGRGDLDVEANHVVLAGDNHDGAVLRVDGAFHLAAVLAFRVGCFISLPDYCAP